MKLSTIYKLAALADLLDKRGYLEEANMLGRVIYSTVSFDKPVRVYYDNDADGIFSYLIFKYYSGANIIGAEPGSAGFDLKRDDDRAMYVVLDTRSASGVEDLRIDHHQGGKIKETDIVDTSALSCAGLVASIFAAGSVDPKVIQELNALDGGRPTYFDWSNAEFKTLQTMKKEAFESWDVFTAELEGFGVKKLEKKDIEKPEGIEEIGLVRTFGSWDMHGSSLDKYVSYFINVEYPKGEAFTELGKTYSADRRPEEPYQIFIANSPGRTDLNIGSMLEQIKKQMPQINCGGRANVGGASFADKDVAEKVYQEILNRIR